MRQDKTHLSIVMNKKSVKLMIPAAVRQSFWRRWDCFVRNARESIL